MTDYNVMRDEELILLGSVPAVNVLLERYKNMVLSKSRTVFFLGADREDVIQEGMIGLAKAISNYDLKSGVPFKAFAESCVVHQMVDSMRRYGAQKHAPLNEAVPLEDNIGDSDEKAVGSAVYYESPEPSPEDLFIEQENFEQAKAQIIQKLTPFETEVFELYTEGFSYAEIAQRTGHSVKSIDNAIRKIKQKAKE